MDLRAARNREYRRLLSAAFGISAVLHGAALALTFGLASPALDETPRAEKEMSRPPFVPRPIEIIRLSSVKRVDPSPYSTPVARPPSIPAPRATPSSAPIAPISELPVTPISPDGESRPAVPVAARVAPDLLSRVAVIDERSVLPVVFEDLAPSTPKAPSGAGDQSDSEDEGGGWLSGITGIFGDIGVSLDGGICPVPRGRAGWR